MKFKTWEEMYRYLENEGDLYNPLLELYVFLYNEAGALCTYNISEEKAMELSVKSKKYNEDWSAFLSVGGNILDNDDFDREHKRDSYLELSYEFCKKHFNKDGWSDTKRIKNGGELI